MEEMKGPQNNAYIMFLEWLRILQTSPSISFLNCLNLGLAIRLVLVI